MDGGYSPEQLATWQQGLACLAGLTRGLLVAPLESIDQLVLAHRGAAGDACLLRQVVEVRLRRVRVHAALGLAVRVPAALGLGVRGPAATSWFLNPVVADLLVRVLDRGPRGLVGPP